MHLLLIFAAIFFAHWSYAAVVPIPVDAVNVVTTAGQCPVYKFRCLIACPMVSSTNPCANGGPNCCTSDCQCKRNQKCCQPACGCYKQCTDVTSYVPTSTVTVTKPLY